MYTRSYHIGVANKVILFIIVLTPDRVFMIQHWKSRFVVVISIRPVAMTPLPTLVVWWYRS